MPDQILLGGHRFTAVKTLDLTRDASAPTHALENGTDVSDHISLRPAKFEIEFVLLRDPDEYAVLETLYAARQPFRLVTPRGVYENIVLLKLSDQYGAGPNTTKASVSLQQVLIVETQTVEIKSALAAEVKPQPDEDLPGTTRVITGVIMEGPYAAAKGAPTEPASGRTWGATLDLYVPQIEAVKLAVRP